MESSFLSKESFSREEEASRVAPREFFERSEKKLVEIHKKAKRRVDWNGENVGEFKQMKISLFLMVSNTYFFCVNLGVCTAWLLFGGGFPKGICGEIIFWISALAGLACGVILLRKLVKYLGRTQQP